MSGDAKSGDVPAGQTSGPTPPVAASAARNELSLRVRSGLVMVAVALLTLWWGGWPFALLWIAVAAVAAMEWLKIVAPDGERGNQHREAEEGTVATATRRPERRDRHRQGGSRADRGERDVA